MEKVKLAIAGLGGRGASLFSMFSQVEDCEIVAVCDVYNDRVDSAIEKLSELNITNVKGFTDYIEMFDTIHPDAVYICTSWETHIDIAIAAMERGIRPGIECGGANNVEQCWMLVHTYEKTKTPVMFLENCCYGRFEMSVLRLVKEGKFGELVHAEGGYRHDLRDEVAQGRENRHYRFLNYLNRCGELYPQHPLGPIMKEFNINRGNRLVSLVSMASKACGINDWCRQNKGDDYDASHMKFAEGDVVTTMIKCSGGETITLTHDTTLPRPYSRGNVLQGTKGIWCEPGWGLSNGLALEGVTEETHHYDNFGVLLDDPEIEHPLWTEFRKNGVKGGHDGMDWLVFNAFIHSVKNNIEPPIDVYDAALLMSIVPLTEMSIAQGSSLVAIPDFTCGKWIHREDAPKNKYSLDKIHYDLFPED